MMKYKEFLSLSDDEIREIVTEIFTPISIENITRNIKYNEISFTMVTGGWVDGEEVFECKDTVCLCLPEESSDYIQVNFSLNNEDEKKYKQYLLSKGCHWLLKDNKYLKE